MSIKEDVEEQVRKIAVAGKAVDEKVIAFVQENFRRTLADCGRAGTSVKHAVTETLEGVEAGLKVAGHTSYNLLAAAADAMVETVLDTGVQTVAEFRADADDVKASLEKVLEKAGVSTDEADAKNKEKLNMAHATLYKRTEAEQARLRDVGDAIKEYSSQKAHKMDETTRAALDRTTEKINDHT